MIDKKPWKGSSQEKADIAYRERNKGTQKWVGFKCSVEEKKAIKKYAKEHDTSVTNLLMNHLNELGVFNDVD